MPDFNSTRPSIKRPPARRRKEQNFHFRGLKVDLGRINREWEQQRGAMIRIALLVLRDNDTQLARKFCRNDEAAETGLELIGQLHDEEEYLKMSCKILESAMARLMAVIPRRDSVRAKERPHG